MENKCYYKAPVYLSVLLAVAMPAMATEKIGCIAYLNYTEDYWQVWRMDERGQNKKQITRSPYDKSRVSWYPDGNYLLVNGNQGVLFKVDIKTGLEESVDIGFKGMYDAVLSPDGQYVGFGLSTSGSRDDHNIWIVNMDKTGPKKLTNLKQMQHLPTWSTDGKWILFSSKTNDQHNDIKRVSLDGKKTESLTINALYNFDAVASIDNELAFSSNRSGSYEIWKQSPNEEPVQLTKSVAKDARPSWSPDGQSIVFESSHGGTMNIWKMNSNGKSLTQLTQTEQGARFPVWSPANVPESCH